MTLSNMIYSITKPCKKRLGMKALSKMTFRITKKQNIQNRQHSDLELSIYRVVMLSVVLPNVVMLNVVAP
jgi:hypothetical protein